MIASNTKKRLSKLLLKNLPHEARPTSSSRPTKPAESTFTSNPPKTAKNKTQDKEKLEKNKRAMKAASGKVT